MLGYPPSQVGWVLVLGAAVTLLAGTAARSEAKDPAAPELVRVTSKGYITFYDLSPDGKTLAYGEMTYRDDRGWSELVFVDTATGKELRRGPAESGLMAGVFSPDGKLLALGLDRALVIWDADGWKERHTLKLPDAGRYCIPLAFSPDGKLIAGVSFPKGVLEGGKGILVLWEVATGKFRCLVAEEPKDPPRKVLGVPSPDFDSKSEAKAVCFADDGGPFLFAEHQHQAVHIMRPWDLTQDKALDWVRAGVWDGDTSDPMQYLARQGRRMPGYPASVLRFRTTPGGQVLALPRYQRPPVAAVPHRDGTIALVVVPAGEHLIGNPTPGSGRQELHRFQDFKGTDSRSCVLSSDGKRLVAVGEHPKRKEKDGPRSLLLAWDVSAFHAAAATKPAKFSTQDLGRCWDDLAQLGHPLGPCRAMFALASSPELAVPFLQEKFRSPPDLTQVPRLLEQLNSNDFPTRERATADLERLGPAALPLLERALKQDLTLEQKTRLGKVLDKLRPTAAAYEFRFLRLLDVLEHINSREARDLLRAFADGKYDPAFADEAQKALQRATAKP